MRVLSLSGTVLTESGDGPDAADQAFTLERRCWASYAEPGHLDCSRKKVREQFWWPKRADLWTAEDLLAVAGAMLKTANGHGILWCIEKSDRRHNPPAPHVLTISGFYHRTTLFLPTIPAVAILAFLRKATEVSLHVRDAKLGFLPVQIGGGR